MHRVFKNKAQGCSTPLNVPGTWHRLPGKSVWMILGILESQNLTGMYSLEADNYQRIVTRETGQAIPALIHRNSSVYA